MNIFSKRVISNNLKKENRDDLIRAIKTYLQKHSEVKQVYIFGSFANETHTDDSDIDILIVAKTDKSFVERSQAYSQLLDIYAPMDILVYTEEEFLKIQHNESNGFWKTFQRNHLKIM